MQRHGSPTPGTLCLLKLPESCSKFFGFSGSTFDYILRILLGVLILLGLATAIFSPRYLSEDRLKVLGFVFSAVGLLTGFLPAILDVMGITVR
jgi:hypothetical protein